MTASSSQSFSSVNDLVLPGTLDEIGLANIASNFDKLDLDFFRRCLVGNDLDRVLQFTDQASACLAQIEQSQKPVVAWVRGPACGAGVELALACHTIVAGPNAKFSFPETGLGIYPGMGGTQRTPRRIGVGLAKWMLFTGAIVPAEQALGIGLIDAIHPTATSAAEACGALQSPHRSPASRPLRLAAIERLFAEKTLAELQGVELDSTGDAQIIRTLVQMRGKSPTALRLAEKIIDAGLGLTQFEGIKLEFAHLREVFSTPEARARLLPLERGGIAEQA